MPVQLGTKQVPDTYLICLHYEIKDSILNLETV